MSKSFYPLAMLQAEVHHLLEQGIVNRKQPIHTLCKYVSVREWQWIEQELEENEFLLRDPIGELISHEEWNSD